MHHLVASQSLRSFVKINLESTGEKMVAFKVNPSHFLHYDELLTLSLPRVMSPLVTISARGEKERMCSRILPHFREFFAHFKSACRDTAYCTLWKRGSYFLSGYPSKTDSWISQFIPCLEPSRQFRGTRRKLAISHASGLSS